MAGAALRAAIGGELEGECDPAGCGVILGHALTLCEPGQVLRLRDNDEDIQSIRSDDTSAGK